MEGVRSRRIAVLNTKAIGDLDLGGFRGMGEGKSLGDAERCQWGAWGKGTEWFASSAASGRPV